MATTHNLGFPRIGEKRELKFALEDFWKGTSTAAQLEQTGAQLRERHWRVQSKLDLVPSGDFSFYDQVLDMSFMLGNIPDRVRGLNGDEFDNYFRVARGRSSNDSTCSHIHAGEMTKWFDTNYHYIVPEFSAHTDFSLDASRLIAQINQARALNVKTKPVIIGPLTYLWLGKAKDESDKLTLLPKLLPVYEKLLKELTEQGVEWVQIDEPILVTELDSDWQQAFSFAYKFLQTDKTRLLLTTYFGELQNNLNLVCSLPVQGIHVDAINGHRELPRLLEQLPEDKILSLGVINGRNIWKTDIHKTLEWLEPIHRVLQHRLWIAPSCSLLHVPVDLRSESRLDSKIQYWLAFAMQKLDELQILADALNHGRVSVQDALVENSAAIEQRRASPLVHNPAVKVALQHIDAKSGQRISSYATRADKQSAILNLPAFPTTTIGSFPQTREVRQTRSRFRSGELDEPWYKKLIREEIARCVREQEALGLDVFVHGEAERNDMVEYFGEQLDGFAFTEFGWVQSYGSRCVKPPILFGDISRQKPMTVEWITYAQSLTDKPVKGMLTGPVTILNWSFVRDDQPRSISC